MTGNVISLFGGHEVRGDPTAVACQRFADLRRQSGMSAEQFAFALAEHLPWAPTAGHVLAWETDVAPPGDVVVVAEVVGAPAPGELPDHVAAMKAFRAADLRAGGTPLYPAVTMYLKTHIAPLLVSADGDGATFAAAAGLTDMAGWMAHDAGEDDVARTHFARALQFAQMAGDAQVTAHVSASTGHLAHHCGDGATAVQAARAGLLALAAVPAPAGLASRLHAIQARGLAALGEGAEALAQLDKAEDALGRSAQAPLSPWVSACDEATLASEAARCRYQLGQIAATEDCARRVLELRPPGRPRSRALGLLVHARAAVARGSVDEAALICIAVLDEASSISSQVIAAELAGLGRQLKAHRSREVADFLGRFHIASSTPRLVLVRES